MNTTLTTLGDCCSIVSGSTPDTNTSEYWDGEICWATPKDISELSSAYIHTTQRKLTKAGLESCSATILPAESVLFSSRAPIGYVAINTVPMCTNQGFKSFIPDAKKVFPKFLYYWLKFNRRRLENLGNGATFKELSKAIVSQVQITLPPIDEQRHIAGVLDKADALREKRRQGITKLDTLLQSVFLDMFGDPITNPKGWEMTLLGELGDGKDAIVDGPFGSAINVVQDYSDRGDVPIIRTKNVNPFRFITDDLKFISNKKFESVKRSAVLPNDIVLTKVGTIGNVCIFPSIFEKAVLSTTGSCRIRPNTKLVNTDYLAFFLHLYKPEMLKFASQGVQAFLNMKHIKSFRVPKPPFELQEQFATKATRIRGLKNRFEESSASSDVLFDSLLQRAFTGESFT